MTIAVEDEKKSQPLVRERWSEPTFISPCKAEEDSNDRREGNT